MLTIWKFDLSPAMDGEAVLLPMHSRWLDVQTQNLVPRLWALVDPTAEKVEYRFWVRGTGHDVEMGISECYIGTWQDGPFVWHLFGRTA